MISVPGGYALVEDTPELSIHQDTPVLSLAEDTPEIFVTSDPSIQPYEALAPLHLAWGQYRLAWGVYLLTWRPR